MDLNLLELRDGEIQYVYDSPPDLQTVEGLQAFVIDGQYYLADSSAIILDGNELFVSEDTSETFVIKEETPEPPKTIKLEGQLMNLQDFVQGEEASYEFAFFDEDEETESVVTDIDLSQIKGRNLITGQTVSLDGYMQKLKRREKNRKIEQSTKSHLNHLLDKKISIGTTRTGKKIVGKIIHVEKKNVTQQSHEEISKILDGLMEMSSVKKRLAGRKIIVKLVEKKYNPETGNMDHTTTYNYGTMIQKTTFWFFEPDQQILKKTLTSDVTIFHTTKRDGAKTISVKLNPGKSLDSADNISLHICSGCQEQFGDLSQLEEHRNSSDNCTEIKKHFSCDVCTRVFSRHSNLLRHMEIHKGNGFRCEVCDCSFNYISSLTRHMVQNHIEPMKE